MDNLIKEIFPEALHDLASDTYGPSLDCVPDSADEEVSLHSYVVAGVPSVASEIALTLFELSTDKG